MAGTRIRRIFSPEFLFWMDALMPNSLKGWAYIIPLLRGHNGPRKHFFFLSHHQVAAPITNWYQSRAGI